MFEKRECVSAAELAALIDAYVADPNNYEPGEPRASSWAVSMINAMLAEAENLGVDLPPAQIGIFWGTVGVTWRNGDRVVRACATAGETELTVGICEWSSGMQCRYVSPAVPETLVAALQRLRGQQ